ncbi:TetR/AcrR family transcriptional regulator [Cohnella fermenti]|uniref:TetR/AcrR family transcriptional regulator n=1 Tax=Cohnella fermenti TaxID=2565925 RepID=A0A4S4BL31_9BACL|nr:TetR/AcrR family transcriptional regulator [Cohnella fermenti]THF72946.1 TetR/AcrR family transcriptional regulator [Cohnella fermenti]
MNGKENQRIRLTRTLLKSSLMERMASKPVSKITIKEICENAGINRSTFYLYYKDQFELLNEVESELLDLAEQHLKKLDSNEDNVHYLKKLLGYMKDNSAHFRILLCHPESLSFQTRFVDISIRNLKHNISLNCPEPISDYVFRYLTIGCLSMITKWIESDFELPVEELSHLIFGLSDSALGLFGPKNAGG